MAEVKNKKSFFNLKQRLREEAARRELDKNLADKQQQLNDGKLFWYGFSSKFLAIWYVYYVLMVVFLSANNKTMWFF